MGLIVQVNHLLALRDALHAAVGQAITKAAHDVEAQAKQRAAVDTGFMRSSIYAVTHAGSDYGQGTAGGPLLPEVARPPDDQTAYVAVGASYGADVEYGTVHAAAQPFLTPALDAVRPALTAALEKLEEKLRGLGG